MEERGRGGGKGVTHFTTLTIRALEERLDLLFLTLEEDKKKRSILPSSLFSLPCQKKRTTVLGGGKIFFPI